MKQAGFTAQEFAKLDAAQAASDGLVALEDEAMHAVQGKFKDAAGAFTVQGEPDLAKARAPMFSDDYYRYKANIMKPLDEFFVLLDERTRQAVLQGERRVGMLAWVFTGTLAVLVALLIVAAWGMFRRVLGPLGRLRVAMTALAANDTTSEVPETWRRDEIGEMAATVKVFQNSMIENQRLQQEQMQAQQAALARAKDLEQLTTRFEAAVGAVLQGVGEASATLNTTAASLSSLAIETRSQAGNAASAATPASADVATVATAAEELSGSIQEIARQVQQSSTMSAQAVDQAGQTQETVEQLAQGPSASARWSA